MSPISLQTYFVSSALCGLALQSGVSEEAQSLSRIERDVSEALEQSQALFGRTSEAVSSLWDLAADHAKADWDGYGAKPVSLESLVLAERLIRSMPHDLPVPEFSVDPDGDISFDWIAGRQKIYSLSVGTSMRLACAWRSGSDHGHEVIRFDGQSIPQRVLFQVQHTMGQFESNEFFERA